MTGPEHNQGEPTPRFRETEPVALWSGTVALGCSYDEFKDTVCRAAVQTRQRHTGFVTRDATGNVMTFTRTRYPRKKYGVTPIAECQEGMEALAAELGGILLPEPARDGFRVVLGLIEGYDPTAPTHSVSEIQEALPAAHVAAAEVFAVRHTDTGASVYTEPVAIIEAPIDQMRGIYRLGQKLKQERFTIEDFERGIAYVVETEFCREPD